MAPIKVCWSLQRSSSAYNFSTCTSKVERRTAATLLPKFITVTVLDCIVIVLHLPYLHSKLAALSGSPCPLYRACCG